MHSAQYLWITSYYARREAAAEGAETGTRNWRPLAYFGVLILGGIALFVPGPWLASRAFHHDFTASFLIFTALVNIHHFILDGAIWKLRDGRIASLLLNTRERISDSAAEAGGKLLARARWLIGRTTAARGLRVTAALLLLTWGTIDQVRYYLAVHTDDLQDLQRAASLNSFDSALQMRLGKRAQADGESQQAEAAWRRAMQANPADPAPRHALLQLLIDQDRFDEALTLTDASLKYSPKDANLLVDRGLLALHGGQADEAVANWNAALKADPSQSMAHLYIADELDREGKAQEAATHYGAFLEHVARQKAQDRPTPDRVIAIVMRMADCQARASQPDLAIHSYRLAEKLALQTQQPKLESVAAVNEAELQAKIGKRDEALHLYQHALQLDQSAGDDTATAQDWYAYGRFLADAGFPSRLAYACFVKSASLMPSPNSPALAPLDTSRKALEKRLGAATTGAIRRNPEPALQEALAFRP
jgi:tetratricopeptide (TPR) repeat protein